MQFLRLLLPLSAALAATLAAASASAQCTPAVDRNYTPIVDRNYNLDLYTGVALGSSRIVSMGGTGVATAQGSAFVSANPAAAAVRSASSVSKWSLSGHFDFMVPGQGRDFDNNGRYCMPDEPNTLGSTTTTLGTAGGFILYKNWAFGVAGSTLTSTVDSVETSFGTARLVLAHTYFEDQLAVGLGLRFLTATIESSGTKLVKFGGATVETGAVWLPKGKSYRVGAKITLPIVENDLKVSDNCDPLDCAGYILPSKVLVPWEMAVGFAWRHGTTVWNRKVESFRDERELTLTSDIVLIGAVNNGHGLEAFLLDKELQPSGRHPILSVRLGGEYEAIPGWLQVRAGTYSEPGRFSRISGRIHGTFGLVVRVWSFRVFGDPQRLTLTLTGDVASRYLNGGVSFGLW